MAWVPLATTALALALAAPALALGPMAAGKVHIDCSGTFASAGASDHDAAWELVASAAHGGKADGEPFIITARGAVFEQHGRVGDSEVISLGPASIVLRADGVVVARAACRWP